MTNILALPLYTFAMTVRTNEDWLDAWAYVDPSSGTPIALDGLTVDLMVRVKPEDYAAVLIASTGPAVAGLPLAGGLVLDGNKVGLSVMATAMGRVPPGVYVFEVRARGDGVMRVIAAGPLTIVLGVVR